MIIIGIVGSPAGGKSTVAGILKGLGGTWIHADKIAKEVLDEPAIQKKLIHYFGSSINGADGKIDRLKLADSVFGDDEEKRRSLDYLESLIHPETKQRITAKIQQAYRRGCKLIALEVPLLFESGWDLVCDEIWCVDASRQRRVMWANHREWSSEDLQKRESNQLPLKIKKRLSNLVIMNNGDRNQLNEIVTERWSSLSRELTIQASGHCFEQRDLS